ncbi:MAG TPA: 1-(5-phosphoribosyl)-5-[(5-phosphoribosylamino)methylideneamino]imidazole-4-carboxamide isomerase [Gemmatimonadaceae bacterium]|nr:1-(5-phosphoribosyl)-5-[(5-phosphoribosylamino)methylideneamino]imidazole-4-carboxamide isomerase [Gemmatimonadaceae bacterium]
MQVIPAIDLRDGSCVQLVGGSYAAERVRIADPIAVAREWARVGFSRIHLVDLDAATGRGSNRDIVREILDVTPAKVQCGGGVRNFDDIDDLLGAGASEVVLGTRAVEDRDWLEEAVARYPGRIIVAADASSGQLVSRGWSQTSSRDVVDFIDELQALPLAAILVTAVEREGRLQGPNAELIEEITRRVNTPIQASGGVRDRDDIRALADAGASATIIGMALYTGALNPQTIIEEMSAWA